jgi:hypothetical protein
MSQLIPIISAKMNALDVCRLERKFLKLELLTYQVFWNIPEAPMFPLIASQGTIYHAVWGLLGWLPKIQEVNYVGLFGHNMMH